MKKSSPFTVQKVKQYSQAKYASESPKSLIRHALWLAWNFPNKMIKGAVTALLIVGLAAGLQACDDGVIYTDGDKDVIYTDGDKDVIYTDGDKDVIYTDGDKDIEYDELAGVEANCSHGQEYCINLETISQCDDGGYYVEKSCETVCREENEAYMSWGCYNDKCQCYYETEGVDVNCSHGEEYCINTETISRCDDGGYYEEKNCDAVCVETHGAGFSSAGCDDSAAEKCQCEQTPADGDLEVEVEKEIDGDLDTGEQEETEPDGDLDLD